MCVRNVVMESKVPLFAAAEKAWCTALIFSVKKIRVLCIAVNNFSLIFTPFFSDASIIGYYRPTRFSVLTPTVYLTFI